MGKDTDTIISSVAAMIVLFASLFNPTATAILSIFALIGIFIYKAPSINKSWKKTIIISLVVASIVALDWAALHDIIKGNQVSYFWEFTTLITSVVALFFLYRNYRKRSKTSPKITPQL